MKIILDRRDIGKAIEEYVRKEFDVKLGHTVNIVQGSTATATVTVTTENDLKEEDNG